LLCRGNSQLLLFDSKKKAFRGRFSQSLKQLDALPLPGRKVQTLDVNNRFFLVRTQQSLCVLNAYNLELSQIYEHSSFFSDSNSFIIKEGIAKLPDEESGVLTVELAESKQRDIFLTELNFQI
jgi:hypothetical protein